MVFENYDVKITYHFINYKGKTIRLKFDFIATIGKKISRAAATFLFFFSI